MPPEVLFKLECMLEDLGVKKVASIHVVGKIIYVMPTSYWKKGKKHGVLYKFRIWRSKLLKSKPYFLDQIH